MSQNKQHHTLSKDEIVTQNYGLLVSTAQRFYPSTKDELEEYIQVGSIGMLKAIDTYDSSKSKFTTYACSCIFNEIYNYLRKLKKHQNNVHDIVDFEERQQIDIEDYFPEDLTEKERFILKLRLHDYTRKEISDILGESENSTKYLIRKTLQKIRKANED
ncbi:MAG: sigma-70 family RNA polymerase sigma factor [Candidatus Heimdallarchaeaceae archaeon]|jgi:RNA polymerase sporulation-specific sigma factor